MTNPAPREATTDESDGLRWWNGLSEQERSSWCREAYSAVPADAWALHKLRSGRKLGFEVEVVGLAAGVDACEPRSNHNDLLKVLRSFEQLHDARQVAVTGGDGTYSLGDCKVLDAAGSVVHRDHIVWLAEQVAKDGGSAPATYHRLKDQGFRLSRCDLTYLTFVQDRGYAESQFLQVKVQIEDEWIDRELFTQHPWREPQSVKDLYQLDGPEVAPEDRRRVRPSAYRLVQVADVDAFVRAWAAHDAHARGLFQKKRFVQKERGARDVVVDADTAFPGWNAAPMKAHRIFSDWAASSAGESGAKISDHWVFKLSDYTDAAGQRHLSYIPEWTTRLKLAKVEGERGALPFRDLYAGIQAIDRRVGVPFAWYFFMLHGNRVDGEAATRIHLAAKNGAIALPDRDMRVLDSWIASPYGF